MRRWIVLSPHLDDAALSLGGLIAALQTTAPVEIWSLFCNATLHGPYSPLAQWLHKSSGGSSGSLLAWHRRREDMRACRKLGAAARHFPWKDAPYRKTRNGGFMYEATQAGLWHPEEQTLIAAMISLFRKTVAPSDILVSPLAIGGHVDHLLTRYVAEQLERTSLMYYPEVPYVELYAGDLPLKTAGLCDVGYALTRDEIVTWIDASKSYVTQMPMLEGAAGPLPEIIHRHASKPLSLYRSCATELDLSAYGIFAKSLQ